MKKLLLVLCCIFCGDMSAFACETYDYESITINIDASVGLTDSKLTPANSAMPESALITFETAQSRFRTDGSSPTASEGHLTEIGDKIEVTGRGDMQRLAIISTHATSSGTAKVSYCR